MLRRSRREKNGLLVPPKTCEECGREPRTTPGGYAVPDMHHPDYSKPLAVQWLCRSCHIKRHHAVQQRCVRHLGYGRVDEHSRVDVPDHRLIEGGRVDPPLTRLEAGRKPVQLDLFDSVPDPERPAVGVTSRRRDG